MKLDILKALGTGLLCAGLLAMPAQAASGADLNARQCVAVVLDLGSVSFGETGFGSGLRVRRRRLLPDGEARRRRDRGGAVRRARRRGNGRDR